MKNFSSTHSGIALAASAFGLWGLLPLFWKLLELVPAPEILAHRMIWSGVAMVLLMFSTGRMKRIKSLISSPRTIALFFLTATLVGANWLIYIWAVNNSFVLEASLGYFINPLVNVLLGILFLGERPRRAQIISITIAALGVAYLATSYGQVPWIALALAFTFAFYSLFRKTSELDSVDGLFVETLVLFSPALIYLYSIQGFAFFEYSTNTQLLLALTGPVTATPLLLFAAAAKRLTLSTLGIMQYLTPTLNFVLAVFVFHEALSSAHLVCFAAIWTALVIYSLEGFSYSRRLQAAKIAN